MTCLIFILVNALQGENWKILSTLSTSWDYILEVSPWWGGFWEWMVHVVQRSQGTIQKKSVSASRTLPCLVIFFWNFILIWKCGKCFLNRVTLVSASVIYQMKCPFTVLSALFWFFWTLPYNSRLFPENLQKILLKSKLTYEELFTVICEINQRSIQDGYAVSMTIVFRKSLCLHIYCLVDVF